MRHVGSWELTFITARPSTHQLLSDPYVSVIIFVFVFANFLWFYFGWLSLFLSSVNYLFTVLIICVFADSHLLSRILINKWCDYCSVFVDNICFVFFDYMCAVSIICIFVDYLTFHLWWLSLALLIVISYILRQWASDAITRSFYHHLFGPCWLSLFCICWISSSMLFSLILIVNVFCLLRWLATDAITRRH